VEPASICNVSANVDGPTLTSYAVAVAVVVWVIMGAPASADACSMRYFDVFTQAERAETVAIGVVVPGGIRAEHTFKGGDDESDAVHIHNWRGDPERWTSCVPRVSTGARRLVFVDDNNRFVAHYQSAVRFDGRSEDRQALVEAMSRWHDGDDTERLALLIELVGGSDVKLAREAAHHLVDRVDWFDDIGEAETKALREAFASGQRPIYSLGWLLVRLGDQDVAEVFDELEASSPTNRAASVARELLERRHDADIDDRGELADIVEKGPEEIDRIAAFERCEREVGTSLYGFERYRSGVADHFWKKLAEACRQGEPVD
jgi:hypothetical protein